MSESFTEKNSTKFKLFGLDTPQDPILMECWDYPNKVGIVAGLTFHTTSTYSIVES